MSKYKISREFFPFSHFTPPISEKFLKMAVPHMKTPKYIFKDKELDVSRHEIESYDGENIECFLKSPKSLENNVPCLIYIHGGGFVLAAAGYHYKNALRYAGEVGCKVVFVNYRLAPKNPHPTPAEDCYAALRWTFENSGKLNVDTTRIAVGGDSAGGALAAAVCQMARDRGTDMPLFQLLVYPVTDRRMNYDSCRKYTDTPMWNAKLSVKMWQGYVQDENAPDIAYASPMETQSFEKLPSAYVETAEFDCLHDEGIAYAEALRKADVSVELNETRGTMHGFDIVQKAQTTKAALAERIAFMKKVFKSDN